MPAVPAAHRHVRLGIAGLATLVLAVGIGFRAGDLPLVGGGPRYHAELAESGGLKVGDPVQIAGVAVGRISAMRLDDGHVDAEFRIRDGGVRLTSDARAEVRIRTILGAMALTVIPSDGGETMPRGGTIPLRRTTTPLQIVDAVSDVAEQSARIDTDQLAASLGTLADLTRNTPEEFRAALAGVAGLARTISERDEQIGSLLSHLDRVSGVLEQRDGDVVQLMRSTAVLGEALVARRAQIHRVLVATSDLAVRLSDLIRRTRADLGPALTHLTSVVEVLSRNEDNIDRTVASGAVFTRVFSAVSGNGPWLDGYIFNLPPDLVPVPSSGSAASP